MCIVIRKYKLPIIIIISLLFITIIRYGYKSSHASDLNREIKNYIDTKGLNYNYVEDINYQNKIDELVEFITKDDNFNEDFYTTDDLNGSGIPELVIFRERNPRDEDDPGYLEVYSYKNDKYSLYDRVSMNYDNTNYQLKTGFLSSEQKGILLNNQVGAHSGMTYGFILKDDSLKNILNGSKLNLVSTYTDNFITDINGDGTLEFSVYTIDPESDESNIIDSDKLLLWYSWDELDSADLIDIGKYKNTVSEKFPNGQLVEYLKEFLLDNPASFDNLIDGNLEVLERKEITYLLFHHLKNLDKLIDSKNEAINSLVSNYGLRGYFKDPSNYNDRDFLLKTSTLANSPELKNELISNLNLGYRLRNTESNSIDYTLDYKSFNNNYKDHILQEYVDYLTILSNNPDFTIDNQNQYMTCLTNKMLEIEKFKSIYPYSDLISELDDVYYESLNIYLFGHKSNRHYNENKRIAEDVFNKLVATSKKYSSSLLGSNLNLFIDYLKDNNYIVDESLVGKIDKTKGFEF